MGGAASDHSQPVRRRAQPAGAKRTLRLEGPQAGISDTRESGVTMKSFTIIAILLAAPTAVAQSGDDWNFLSDTSIFRDVHGTLPAYLKDQAGALLDERERAIARIATMADLTARQQYFRDRMWSYLGGRPERTPLNARVVGTLDRGDFRIEKVIFESRPGF